MNIKKHDICMYLDSDIYKVQNKTYIIKRKLFTHYKCENIDLLYWIYEKKRFLFWDYLSVITRPDNNSTIVTTNSIDEAKKYIDTMLLYKKNKVEYY